MAAYSGFREEDYDEVFIILDKMDKIGAEGVAKELEEMGYAKENVETYLQLFQDVAPDVTGIRFLKEKLGDCLSGETADSMEMIISSVETTKECEFNITGSAGFDIAQVTSGGVNLSEINPETCESKIVENLYFAGEIMDVDGPCGGYNLHFAWSSGIAAGKSVH